MLRQANPTLAEVEWNTFTRFIPVEYDPDSFLNRHWVCPHCDTVNSVKHNTCKCGRTKVKKVVRFNREGNPVEKWVMLK